MEWLKIFKSKDERIDNLTNKVYKEAYMIAMLISFCSIGVKYYYSGITFASVLPEFLIIMVPAIYYWIRIALLGIYSDEVEMHDRESRIKTSYYYIILGLVSGLAIALFFGIRNSMLYGDETNRLYYFGLVFTASLIIYIPFFVSLLAGTHYFLRRISKKASAQDE